MTPVNQDDKCGRCKEPRRKHWALTFCNGIQQSGEVLVCPTAVFQEPEGLDDENLRTWKKGGTKR